jgi:hypothetical protein
MQLADLAMALKKQVRSTENQGHHRSMVVSNAATSACAGSVARGSC